MTKESEALWKKNDENLAKFEDSTIEIIDFGGNSTIGGYIILKTGEKLQTSFPVVQSMGKFVHEQIEKRGSFEMIVVKKTSRRLGTTHYWVE